jgi:hypothetical protein
MRAGVFDLRAMQKRYKFMLAAAALLLGGKLAVWWWNPDELVTFHGKDVPIAQAFDSFSKQTGRKILHPSSLNQKVTLNLEKVPLEDALELTLDQTNLSMMRLFLLTSDSKRKSDLLSRLSQQTEPPVMVQLARAARWSGPEDRDPGLITYKADSKPVDVAVAEINMATRSFFYHSGDSTGPISLDWNDVPVRAAADQLASLTDTDAERVYQIFDRNRETSNNGGGGNRRPRGPDFSFEDLDRWYEKTEAQIATLPPAEKAVAEAQFRKQQERMEEFAALTPEQRMERMMQRFTSGNQEERLIRRLKNSTPESRAKRYQRFESRRQARGDATPTPATPKPANP